MAKPLTVVALLLALLTYLLVESQSSDQVQRTRIQRALQAMQLHDAQLNRDVLEARAGLLGNYDSLAQTGRELSLDMAIVERESAAIGKPAAGLLDRQTAALHNALRHKLALIEYFKSDNALLRNSLAYFAQSLGAVRERSYPSKLAIELGALSHVMLRFVQSPGAETTREAQAALARMPEARFQSDYLRPLAVHGRLIVETLPLVDAQLQEIVTSPVNGALESLEHGATEYGGRTEARALRFRLLLYAVSLVLLGYLLHQYTRLRTKARELRWKELQLIQANKMTALGTLVSGVAHEIKNPNQIVLMNAGLVANAWDDAIEILDSYQQDAGPFSLAGLPYSEMRGTLSNLIRELQEGSRRIERILSELKEFARPNASVTEMFQLNDVVHRALRLLTHAVRKRTDHLDVRLSRDLPRLRGNSQQVEQVVVNLVMNALEALPSKDRLVEVITSLDPERALVSLEVHDEGVGIPKRHLTRLGQPFFTTKDASGGTGLGLAITSSLVRSHGGKISFVSEPGKGTRARVTFPFPCDRADDPGGIARNDFTRHSVAGLVDR